MWTEARVAAAVGNRVITNRARDTTGHGHVRPMGPMRLAAFDIRPRSSAPRKFLTGFLRTQICQK